MHCLFIALQSRNTHCVLQPHKYPLNITFFPLVMSKHMKNKMSSGFWHGVFGVTHYHLLYMTELPAGIIQRLHAPTSVTLKMDSAHFSETSCQPRNLQQFQNRTVVRRVVMAWKPLLQIDVLLHLFMFNARSTTEWILQKKKKKRLKTVTAEGCF